MKLKHFLLAAGLLLSLNCLAKQWIIFHAETIAFNAPVGHAFVTFIQEDVFLKQTKFVGAWGFYPQKKMLRGIWGSIPGTIRDDWQTHSDLSFIVEVNLTVFNNCLKIKDRYRAGFEYSLNGQSCVTFVRDVSNAIPTIVHADMLHKFPGDVVADLKAKNAASEKTSIQSLKNSIGNITGGSKNAETQGLTGHTSYQYALLYIFKGQQLTLLGKQPTGVTVTLLNFKTGQSFTSNTVSVKKAYDEIGNPIIFTTLDKQPPKGQQLTEGYSIAVVKAAPQLFKLMSPIKMNSAFQAEAVDTEVKEGDFLSKLLKDGNTTNSSEYLSILTNRRPMLYQFNLPGMDITVGHYPLFLNYGTIGPRLIIINSKIYPLSGQCSGKDFQVYQLGLDFFIHSASTCCECGLHIEEIFELNEDGVIKVFANDGYSN